MNFVEASFSEFAVAVLFQLGSFFFHQRGLVSKNLFS